MGALSHCIFTDLPIKTYRGGLSGRYYFLIINGHNYTITLDHEICRYPIENPFIIKNKNLLFGLLYNGDWFKNSAGPIHVDYIKQMLAEKRLPVTHDEKFVSVFEKLCSYHKLAGDIINFNPEFYDSYLWKVLYLQSKGELDFYFQELVKEGHIETVGENKYAFRLPLNGLNLMDNLRKLKNAPANLYSGESKIGFRFY